MRNNKSFQILMVLVSAGVVLFGMAITRAFMETSATGEEGTVVKVVTDGNLMLSYTDCSSSKLEDCASISAELSPSEKLEKTFQISNDSGYDVEYNLYFQEILNTFKNDDLVYKIENIDTGEVVVEETPVPEFASLTKDQVAMTTSIAKNTTENLKMTITFLNRDYSQNENLNAKFEIKLSILKSDKNPVELIMAKAHTDSPNFATVATTDEGVYAMEDNYGTSYYFRGAVTNNYVKFAGFYWRIIRVNGDGSIRMIYDGTTAHVNGENSLDRVALTDVAWNITNNNDTKYVGYIYGGNNGEASTTKEQAQTNETSSNAKIQLEAWYKEYIEDKGFEQYLTDVIFCSDRSTPNSLYSIGYATNETYYGAHNRFITNQLTSVPTFICSTNNLVNENNDWYTAEATTLNKGNGALDQPVGLITADEIVAAGSGQYNIPNLSYFLYKGHWYWSISPSGFHVSFASVFRVYDEGYLSNSHVNNIGSVVPVINISSTYANQLVGSGTMTDPYTLG